MTSPTAQMYSLPPSMSQFYTAAPTQAVGEAGMVAPLAMPQLQQKMQRSDRLEVSGEPRSACAIYIAPGRGVGSGPSVLRLSVRPPVCGACLSLPLSRACVRVSWRRRPQHHLAFAARDHRHRRSVG